MHVFVFFTLYEKNNIYSVFWPFAKMGSKSPRRAILVTKTKGIWDDNI